MDFKFPSPDQRAFTIFLVKNLKSYRYEKVGSYVDTVSRQITITKTSLVVNDIKQPPKLSS
jgi:hypothetical protein